MVYGVDATNQASEASNTSTNNFSNLVGLELTVESKNVSSVITQMSNNFVNWSDISTNSVVNGTNTLVNVVDYGTNRACYFRVCEGK